MSAAPNAGTPPDEKADALQLIPGAFATTDSGNAERFIARFRGDVKFVGRRNRWLFWNGKEWEWDEHSSIARKIKATVRGIKLEGFAETDMEKRKELLSWAKKSEGVGKRAAIETLARAETGVTISIDELDCDPWLLNCENGVLDLRTCELHTHRRSDMITKTTGVSYVAGASTELWERILFNMTGGDTDLASYLQRIAGYALTGVATEKKFFFLHGAPDSGKSTFIISLMACMGSYARTTPFETWLEHSNTGGNRDDLVALHGVRLVTSGEVSQNKHWDTAIIKQITGGDRISASAKYESQIEFSPMCTIILAANDAPKARDDDDGFWKRMCRIPIDHVVPASERIKDLHAMLREPENAQAILAWAVEGCKQWRSLGSVGTARVVEESTALYRDDNDWIGAFLELYETDEDSVISATNFRSQYEAFCKQEGQRPEATKTLSRRIEKRMSARYVKVRGVRMWRGLRLRGDPGPEYHQGDLPNMPPEERFE